MKQEEAIESILPHVKNDEAVEAVFLKGSIARGEYDEYSDVDFYCLVKEDKKADFLEKRFDYLRKYRNLIFWSESNFVGPQIVAVFDNGLHFDFYTVTEPTLPEKDEIKVLYDPKQLLSDYKPKSLSFTSKQIIKLFNSFTFSLLEFETAYLRKDLMWASRLGGHLISDLCVIVRYINNPSKAQLGIKNLNNYIDENLNKKLIDIYNNICPERLPHGVKQLLDVADEMIPKLPEEVRAGINEFFYNYMSKKIRDLD
ncbi:nucleotidyltransferase domain-containing protein [Natranaerobius thermophilus]|uniref:DNA polymerase beta domain protein region n=1 Tax=Natranaerobius thermophilus (strain ATCC BAA-1301 / DSM 18059 / JW/NM-WN-LF) TaxID=457570 RepID=B2A128_NATTJ|nr:nucleotidyltransferase domain-containing protein [Natranaerobius thermophilus]ACB84651.1 DNA polymerase beta domain protein region [Natranaerobius thermophilus JW/NM-WN-LF]